MKFREILVVVKFIFLVGTVFAADGVIPGDGTEENTYLIEDANDLLAFADASNEGTYWAKGVYTRLEADVDLDGTSMSRIGLNPDHPYKGVFDGNGHVISNLTYNLPDTDCVGLFGSIGTGGQVSDLGIVDIEILGHNYVGGLAGHIDSGTLLDCYVTGNVNGGSALGGLVGISDDSIVRNCNSTGSFSGYRTVGGLVGSNWGTLSNCHSAGDVEGESRVGGLAGSTASGAISYCYSACNVHGNDSFEGCTGGLIGYASIPVVKCFSTGSVTGEVYVGGLIGTSSDVIDCYSTGSVSGDCFVGGLVGESREQIYNCYSTGNVEGRIGVGGLVGRSDSYVIDNCYSACNVSGDENVGGMIGIKISGSYSDCIWNNDLNPLLEDCGYASMSDVHNVDLAGVFATNTVAMQNKETYLAVGWDFMHEIPNGVNEIWQMPGDVDSYPQHMWGMNVYDGGSGRADDPYQMSTAEQLHLLGKRPFDWYMHFVLTADIDMCPSVTGMPEYSAAVIAPVTHWHTPSNRAMGFSGTFDGMGHVVRKLVISSVERKGEDIGLFGCITGATISNLGMEDININTTGEVLPGFVGGLTAINYSGVVSNCYITGSVIGNSLVGGLVGTNYSGLLTSCYSFCDVSGNLGVGGLSGTNTQGGVVSNCYSIGNVSGNTLVGGLLGGNIFSSVNNCYSAGDLSGEVVGGLIGYKVEGTYASCFWDAGVNPLLSDCGYDNIAKVIDIDLEGVFATSTADMMTSDTFAMAGWDFVGEDVNGSNDVWRICVDGVGYPRFSWEYGVSGDFACPDGVGYEDLILLCENWLNSIGTDAGFSFACDANFDGVSDLGDFTVLAANWVE